MKLTKDQVKEIRENFKKAYPPEYNDMFVNETSIDIKYSRTKFHAFKWGYIKGKGWA